MISILLGQLHLHRISATYKFRPNLTYIDLHPQKTKRRQEEGTLSDEAEEDDEEAKPRRDKALGEAKEGMFPARRIQVSHRDE